MKTLLGGLLLGCLLLGSFTRVATAQDSIYRARLAETDSASPDSAAIAPQRPRDASRLDDPLRVVESNRVDESLRDGESLWDGESRAESGEAERSPSTAAPTAAPTRIRLTGAADNGSRENGRSAGSGALITVTSSLAIVLGLFAALAWLARRGSGSLRGRSLPAEAVELLGHSAVAPRQQLLLIRCGARLLLVASSPSGLQTLSEITEASEVDALAALCRGGARGGFATTLRELERQPHAATFVPSDSPAPPRGGLFARA